jgi:hypothetical protein
MTVPPALGVQDICPTSWGAFWFYVMLTRSRAGFPLLFTGSWPMGTLHHVIAISLNTAWLLSVNSNECAVFSQIPSVATRLAHVTTTLNSAIDTACRAAGGEPGCTGLDVTPEGFCIAFRVCIQITIAIVSTVAVYASEKAVRRAYAERSGVQFLAGQGTGSLEMLLHLATAGVVLVAVWGLVTCLQPILGLLVIRDAYFPENLTCPS